MSPSTVSTLEFKEACSTFPPLGFRGEGGGVDHDDVVHGPDPPREI